MLISIKMVSKSRFTIISDSNKKIPAHHNKIKNNASAASNRNSRVNVDFGEGNRVNQAFKYQFEPVHLTQRRRFDVS
jgi:hypothetical protein